MLRPDAESVMSEERAQAALKNYFSKVRNSAPTNARIGRNVPVSLHSDSESCLWSDHEETLSEFRARQRALPDIREAGGQKSPNFLDLKIKLAELLMRHCVLCEHRCGVDRMSAQRGKCGAGVDLNVSSMFDHYGEEPELVPSFTVFTMGCSFRCLHCQNYTISQWLEQGTEMSVEQVAKFVDEARRNGSRNLNVVGGNPDQYLYSWVRVISKLRENMPVVWNSNAYYSLEQARLLQGVVDVYLLDFKYGNDQCAKSISGPDNYLETVRRNHLIAYADAEMIVRILVLPEHLECCLRPIAEWLSDRISPDVRVNLLWQYRPEWRAHERKELSRRLTEQEMHDSLKMAKESGLSNIIT